MTRILTKSDIDIGYESCALCKGGLVLGDIFVICPNDRSVHHHDCWQLNGNKCSAYGCAGRTVFVNPLTPHPPVSPFQVSEKQASSNTKGNPFVLSEKNPRFNGRDLDSLGAERLRYLYCDLWDRANDYLRKNKELPYDITHSIDMGTLWVGEGHPVMSIKLWGVQVGFCVSAHRWGHGEMTIIAWAIQTPYMYLSDRNRHAFESWFKSNMRDIEVSIGLRDG